MDEWLLPVCLAGRRKTILGEIQMIYIQKSVQITKNVLQAGEPFGERFRETGRQLSAGGTAEGSREDSLPGRGGENDYHAYS